jgi:hypothetical protein
MVEFEEELRKKYEGLPSAIASGLPLFERLPEIWYPGWSLSVAISTGDASRWEAAMHPEWKARYGHGLEHEMRPHMHYPQTTKARQMWRLLTDGRGPNMNEEMKAELRCLCCRMHPALYVQGPFLYDTESESDSSDYTRFVKRMRGPSECSYSSDF